MLGQCYSLPNSPQCDWNLSEAGNAPTISGASPTEQCESGGFSTSGKGRSCLVLLWGNVPSEAGTTLFFGQKHLQRSVPNRGHSETGDEGTLHLQLLRDRDGMGWDGLAVPALTGHGHCVTLWHSEGGLAQADHERRSMRRNGFANETWRR